MKSEIPQEFFFINHSKVDEIIIQGLFGQSLSILEIELMLIH